MPNVCGATNQNERSFNIHSFCYAVLYVLVVIFTRQLIAWHVKILFSTAVVSHGSLSGWTPLRLLLLVLSILMFVFGYLKLNMYM